MRLLNIGEISYKKLRKRMLASSCSLVQGKIHLIKLWMLQIDREKQKRKRNQRNTTNLSPLWESMYLALPFCFH